MMIVFVLLGFDVYYWYDVLSLYSYMYLRLTC